MVGHVVVAYAAGVALNVAAAMLPAPVRGGSLLPRALAIVLSLAALPIPFLLDDAPAAYRAIQAAILGMSFGRVIEIVRAPWQFGRGERAVRVLTIFEPRLMKRVPRSAPVKAFLTGVAFCCAGSLLIALSLRLAPPTAPYEWAGWPRWVCAAAAGYFLLEGLARSLTALLPLFGWDHLPIQCAPIRSRSFAEFWGARWNRVVSFWLRRNVFDPVARGGAPRLAIFLSFAVSALLHSFMVLPAAGLIPALWIGAFFVLHGVLATVEPSLGVKRWPSFLGHAFVVAGFLVTIPLFSEPVLRSIGLY
jgi:hypothetical protein